MAKLINIAVFAVSTQYPYGHFTHLEGEAMTAAIENILWAAAARLK
jgi:hypothetical protein